MNKSLLSLAAASLVAACATPQVPPDSALVTATPAPPLSGIDTQNADASVRAQDDFYRHVNGKWLDNTPIPLDKARWGAFDQLDEEAQVALRGIIDQAQKNPGRQQPGSDEQKIGDLYASFMDEAALEQIGLRPLQDELARIDAIRDKKEIPALIGHLARIGVNTPYAPVVHQDNRDSTKYVVDLFQAGLGLPDRDYYLKTDDAKLKQTLMQYGVHVAKMMDMVGDQQSAKDSRSIVALETALAKVQWTKVENRDPVKTYNKVELNRLAELAPGYDWKSFLVSAGIDGKVDYLIVSQPSYITGLNEVVKKTPLPVWKAYFKWHLLSDYAPYLSKRFVDEDFAFNGTVVQGVPENRPRWKRGVDAVENSIGEDLGKLYVAKYFPPESKARMEQLVANLIAAYKQSIDTLDWMGPETKKAAQEKLAKLTTKIGYPKKWRDYSTLNIVAGDLVGNVMRAQAFEYQRNINKLGKPIDRDEWGMTPQTVNAYFNPELNEIVFPAAILQPPFFNAQADDAANYGGIGVVIGHEISHGFDDQGSQFDADGNLRDWWTKDDHDKFAAKTRALVMQYNAYAPVPGYPVNGELTLGENIADNSGMAIAYKAYRLSLQGKAAPVVDGLSGDQRFFEGFAQIWRANVREAEAIRRIKIDPHSPAAVRGTAPLKNQAAFYQAFGIKEGDKMYLPPDQRISIW